MAHYVLMKHFVSRYRRSELASSGTDQESPNSTGTDVDQPPPDICPHYGPSAILKAGGKTPAKSHSTSCTKPAHPAAAVPAKKEVDPAYFGDEEETYCASVEDEEDVDEFWNEGRNEQNMLDEGHEKEGKTSTNKEPAEKESSRSAKSERASGQGFFDVFASFLQQKSHEDDESTETKSKRSRNEEKRDRLRLKKKSKKQRSLSPKRSGSFDSFKKPELGHFVAEADPVKPVLKLKLIPPFKPSSKGSKSEKVSKSFSSKKEKLDLPLPEPGLHMVASTNGTVVKLRRILPYATPPRPKPEAKSPEQQQEEESEALSDDTDVMVPDEHQESTPDATEEVSDEREQAPDVTKGASDEQELMPDDTKSMSDNLDVFTEKTTSRPETPCEPEKPSSGDPEPVFDDEKPVSPCVPDSAPDVTETKCDIPKPDPDISKSVSDIEKPASDVLGDWPEPSEPDELSDLEVEPVAVTDESVPVDKAMLIPDDKVLSIPDDKVLSIPDDKALSIPNVKDEEEEEAIEEPVSDIEVEVVPELKVRELQEAALKPLSLRPTSSILPSSPRIKPKSYQPLMSDMFTVSRKPSTVEDTIQSKPEKTASVSNPLDVYDFTDNVDIDCDFRRTHSESHLGDASGTNYKLRKRKKVNFNLLAEGNLEDEDLEPDSPIKRKRSSIETPESISKRKRKQKPFDKTHFLSYNKRLLRLRRNVCTMFDTLFPDMIYPRRFNPENHSVDYLVEHISNVVQDKEMMPYRISRCYGNVDWDVSIVVCATPKDCLRHLRRRIVVLLKALLPGLKLNRHFDHSSASVDTLIEEVTNLNRPPSDQTDPLQLSSQIKEEDMPLPSATCSRTATSAAAGSSDSVPTAGTGTMPTVGPSRKRRHSSGLSIDSEAAHHNISPTAKQKPDVPSTSKELLGNRQGPPTVIEDNAGHCLPFRKKQGPASKTIGVKSRSITPQPSTSRTAASEKTQTDIFSL